MDHCTLFQTASLLWLLSGYRRPEVICNHTIICEDTGKRVRNPKPRIIQQQNEELTNTTEDGTFILSGFQTQKDRRQVGISIRPTSTYAGAGQFTRRLRSDKTRINFIEKEKEILYYD